jgi:MFS family permease
MHNIPEILDREQIRAELEQRQFLDIQRSLFKERTKRMVVMSLLISALLFTFIFGTIENPFQYTFSKIGNRFTIGNRILFIVWAGYTGFAIQSSVLALFTIEQYTNQRHYTFIYIATGFLIVSALAPSLDHLVFWTNVHLITAGLFALFLTMGFAPFILWVARQNPRLRRNVYIWLAITWGGGIAWYFLLGNTGMFEIWFFGFFILFLLYLSLTLFEEVIVKKSILLLRDEENLNLGIEKIFINLDVTPIKPPVDSD